MLVLPIICPIAFFFVFWFLTHCSRGCSSPFAVPVSLRYYGNGCFGVFVSSASLCRGTGAELWPGIARFPYCHFPHKLPSQASILSVKYLIVLIWNSVKELCSTSACGSVGRKLVLRIAARKGRVGLAYAQCLRNNPLWIYRYKLPH